MTDRDDRSKELKVCQTMIFTPESSLDQHPPSSGLASVILNETKNDPPTITNTDSEGDYETSSEGPHSPRSEFRPTTLVNSYDRNTVPKSTESVCDRRNFFPKGDFEKQNDPSISYTIIGAAESPRTDVASKISNSEDQVDRSANSNSEIEVLSLNGFDELDARRTDYFVAPRIESDANKSESLPVIKIATPWGSYEYPDVHMPAERLVSDSQIDIKEKMRLIAACMDGSGTTASRTTFVLDDSGQFFYPDIGKDARRPRDSEALGTNDECCKLRSSSAVYSRPVTPRTPKLITVTSPKIFSEPFNVLPIIRNPDLESDYTFPPSPSGSSLPFTTNNKAASMCSSFYHRDNGESPRNLNAKKSNYDPLSRIEGELAPLQNELSEIRGKVRALNLDYNLSCIDGIGKFPKSLNWAIGGHQSNHAQIRPVNDDFIFGVFPPRQSQAMAFNARNNIGVLNFGGNNESLYRCRFADRSSVPSAFSYDLKDVENKFSTELIGGKVPGQKPDLPTVSIFSSGDSKPEAETEAEGIILESPKSTERNFSPVVYIGTSRPSSRSSKIEIALQVVSENEKETESCAEDSTRSPEIQLPNFSDKIRIVPIAYTGGMPDPPAEPVFNFAEENRNGLFPIGHKVLKIEHPDAPQLSHREDQISAENSSSFSDTALTLDNETEDSLSARKEEDNSSVENSLISSDRILIKKYVKNNSNDHFSVINNGEDIRKRKTYIRGLISGPEDFL